MATAKSQTGSNPNKSSEKAPFPADELKKVFRTIQVREGDKVKTQKVAVERDEVIAYAEYEDHAVFVTADGQKFSSAAA
ncbi:hypothetical protein ACFJGW_00610 [Burkholderiaceae bacterium UC74_6]